MFNYPHWIIVSALILFFSVSVFAFADGNGSSSNPYQIENCTDLNAISASPGSSYVLDSNIDCNGFDFVPIGLTWDTGTKFTGSFDGNYKTISNLTINSNSYEYVGLFGYVDSPALITNIDLNGGTFTSNNNDSYSAIGSIVGRLSDGIVAGVNSNTTINGGSNVKTVGGLIGYLVNNNAQIIQCSYSGNVTSTYATATSNAGIGGLVGKAHTGNIQNSYVTSTANIVGITQVGGIIGNANNSCGGCEFPYIKKSYSDGNVFASGAYAGGLIGYVGGNGTIIENSFATGPVTGASSTGGLYGTIATAPTDTNNYYDPTTTTQSYYTATTAGNQGTRADWFGTSSAEPLPNWDFNNFWQTVVGALPTKRLVSTDAPNAPSNLATEEYTAGSIDFNFEIPTTGNLSFDITYELWVKNSADEWDAGGSSSWSGSTNSGNTTSDQDDEAFDYNTTYNLRLRSSNDFGESDWITLDLNSGDTPTMNLSETILDQNDFNGAGDAQGWSGDDTHWEHTLPFPFTFYERTYETIYVGSNGFIAFKEAEYIDYYFYDTTIDSEFFYSPLIIAMGVDLETNEIYITEDANRVIIRWDAIELENTDNNVNFEIVLNDNNTFQINYGSFDEELSYGAVVGVQEGSGIYTASAYEGQTVFDNVNAAFWDLLDSDNDGNFDSVDPLFHTETQVTTTGLTNDLNILVGGEDTNQLFSGTKEMVFYDGSTKFMDFNHDFDTNNFDLNLVQIEISSNGIVIDLNAQLQSDQNKTLYLTNNNFASLCVENAPITSITDISSTCDGTNEYNFTTCLTSGSYSTAGISCTLVGSTITVSNLMYSGILGTVTATVNNTSNPTTYGGIPCKSKWECTEWSTCDQNNNQTRTCEDASNCITHTNKPTLIQDCVLDENTNDPPNPDTNNSKPANQVDNVDQNQFTSNNQNNPTEELEKPQDLSLIFGMILIILIVVVFIYNKKK